MASDWKDFAVLLSLALIVVGTVALVSAAHTFTIIKGKVIGKGETIVDSHGKVYTTKTISVRIENQDRVFNIQEGSVVRYAVSDDDAELVEIGSDIELFVSSYRDRVRILN